MEKIYTSATKVTMLLLVIGLLVFTYIGKLDGETYKVALLMVLSFYFGQKTNTPTI